MKKRIFSLFIALICLSTLPVQAFSTDEVDHNLPHNTSYLDNFNVCYEMDGENVIERVLLSNIEIVRTIYHQRFEYYKENATRPYKKDTDYYQAIGG